MHKKPVLLYGIVGGRSGTNKSAALKKITNMISNLDNPREVPHMVKAMADNKVTIMASKDEFASFNDHFEKSSTSNMENHGSYRCTRVRLRFPIFYLDVETCSIRRNTEPFVD